jgi:hypothetical protein
MELTDEQLAIALQRADAAGNTEDATILAQEYARRQQQKALPSKDDAQKAQAQQGPGGFAAFANKSLVELAGAPVDVTNALLSPVGLDSDRPFGGSESIESAAEFLGIDIPDREPETFRERAGAVAGELAGFGVPFIKGAQLLSTTKGTKGRVGKAIIEDLIERPGRAAAIEAAAVPGIATARGIAEENELGPGATLTLELLGGMTPSLAASAAFSKAKLLGRLGYKALVPFLPSGAQARASRAVQELVADPQKAAANIENLRGTELSPSARTDEPALMALEQAVLKESPSEMTRISTKRSESIQKLANIIKRSGNIRDTRAFAKAKLDRLKVAMNARIEKAADDAGAALFSLGRPDEISASIAVRESLEKALADARVQEDQLWSAIQQRIRGPVTKTLSKYKQLDDTLASSQKDDMPASAKALIGPQVTRGTKRGTRAKVKTTTVQELYGLYRKLGEEAAAARAAGQFNKARVAGELRASILNDLDSFSAGGEVGNSLRVAREYSAELNSKFTQGPVGKILRFAREGIERVPEEMTLRTSIGPGKIPAKLSAQAIQRAADDATVMEGIGDFLKAEFLKTAVDPSTGRIRAGSADSFLRKYDEIFELVPAIRLQIQSARSSEDVLRRVTKVTDAARKNLDRPAISTTALLLNAPADREISTILRSPDPKRVMRQIVVMAKRDKTGKSIEGLRAAMSEYLIDSVTSKSALDIQGKPVVGGIKLSNILQDDKIIDSLALLFTPKEIQEIKSAAKQMAAIEKLVKTSASDEIIRDRAGWLIATIGRVIGARAGGKLSSATPGGSLQSAQIGSNVVTKYLNSLTVGKAKQLLIDAVQDPELMKALLTHKNGNVSKKQARVIRSYMISTVGSRLLEEGMLEEAKAEAAAESQ